MSWLSKLLYKFGRPKAEEEALYLHQAYYTLFMDEGGGLKPEAQLVLADLFKQSNFFGNNLHRKVDGSLSKEDMLVEEGSKKVVRGILKRIYLVVPVRVDGADDEIDPDLLELIKKEL